MNTTFREALTEAAAAGYDDRPKRNYRKAAAVSQPTEKMVKLILDLAAEQGTKLPTDEQIASWDFDKASQIIDWYLDRAKTLGLTNRYGKFQGVEIPEGRYAINTEGVIENPINEVNFYRVECETEGKWTGTLYVRHIVSETEHIVKGDARKAVLGAIAEDIEGAFRRYGIENEKCGYCNRNLTNDDSRKYGIGPVCRGKLGF